MQGGETGVEPTAHGGDARIAALAIARVKGVPKDPVPCARFVRERGIDGDAHAGPGARQVSLLALDDIRQMEARFGAPLGFGRFGENVVVEGPWQDARPGDLLALGPGTVLEVTVIGKECHHGCAIRRQTGDCIMPRQGVFARVVAGGEARPGDAVRRLRPDEDLAVVVLAGGRSSRYGSDKREADAGDGRTRLEAAVAVARAVAPEVVVSVGAHEAAKVVEGARVVADDVPDAGPLGGLVASLQACRAPFVIAFAVDQPGVTADLLRVLAARRAGVGLFLRHDGRDHPLPCVVDRAAVLPALRAALEAGHRALHRVHDAAGVAALDASSVADLGSAPDLLQNVNEPGDATRRRPPA